MAWSSNCLIPYQATLSPSEGPWRGRRGEVLMRADGLLGQVQPPRLRLARPPRGGIPSIHWAGQARTGCSSMAHGRGRRLPAARRGGRPGGGQEVRPDSLRRSGSGRVQGSPLLLREAIRAAENHSGRNPRPQRQDTLRMRLPCPARDGAASTRPSETATGQGSLSMQGGTAASRPKRLSARMGAGLIYQARCGLFLPPSTQSGPGPGTCSPTRATDSDPHTDTAGREVEGL